MKITLELTTFRVRAVFDEISYNEGWDGDEPLDPKRTWTPYVLFFEGQTVVGTDWYEIDCLSSVWASEDAEGKQYVEHIIELYFCHERSVKLDDIEIVMEA